MKKIFFTFSLCLAVLFLIGCASKPENEKSSISKEAEAPSEVKSGYITKEYLDWQYKGFGKELPSWIEKNDSHNDSLSEIKQLFPELEDKEILVFFIYGDNRDQTDSLFKSFLKSEKNPENNSEISEPAEKSELVKVINNENKKNKDDDYVKPEVVAPEDQNKVFDLNGDIYSVKEKTWVHVKESYFDADGNLEKEEIMYKVFAILVREDTGL